MATKSQYLRGKSKHLPYARRLLSQGWILRVVVNDGGNKGYWLQKNTEPEMLFAAAHYDHSDAKHLSPELGETLVKETLPYKKFARCIGNDVSDGSNGETRRFQVWQFCKPEYIEEKSRFQL